MTQPNPNLAEFRQQKEALMPQIAQLALEGLSCRDIAKKVGLEKSTVHRWLRELRRYAAAHQPPGTAELTGNAASRYDLIYRKAMEAFNASRADKQIRITEETEMAGDGRGPRKKNTTRTETQSGNANMLSKAKDAVKAIEDLHHGRRRNAAGGPIDLATVTDEDLDAMNDDQLYALEVRALAENPPGDGPIQSPLTPDQLRAMSTQQLRALHAKALAELEAEKP